MRYLFIAILLTGACVHASAQTTFSNLEEYPPYPVCDQNPNPPDPYGDPYCYNHNLNEWAWVSDANDTGSGIGCDQGCNVTGNMSQGCVYCLDGQSLQMNVINSPPACSSNCWGDVAFFNRQSMDSTYDWAYYATLDLYAMTDNAGIANSQAFEFGIEQDVVDPDDSAYTDKYVMFFQCDFMGSQIWNIWWGVQGKWMPAYDASTHQTIPCQASTQFYPPQFNHYIFHFERLLTNDCYKCTSYLDFTIVYGNGTQEYHQLGCDPTGQTCNSLGVTSELSTDWSPGLWTALQLDGDSSENQYSAWADEWTVCLAPSGPNNPCS